MDETKEVKVESVSLNDAKPAPTEVANENATVDELNQKLAELNDKYLRTAAELENTRRRAAIDSEARARARAMMVAEKILPVMDAVDAALKHTPNDEGIKSLSRALESSFTEIGITRIESVGKPMNPALHNAIQVAPVTDGVVPGTVVEELQAGYMFGENVLRTAMVVVAK